MNEVTMTIVVKVPGQAAKLVGTKIGADAFFAQTGEAMAMRYAAPVSDVLQQHFKRENGGDSAPSIGA